MQVNTTAETFELASHARTKHLPEVPVHEARARLRRCLAAEGFSVIADIDLADLLNRRLDKQIEAYFVIEACHPAVARQALAVASDGGLLMPTKLCLWKERTGSTIATLQPARLVGALGRVHLNAVAAEIASRLDRVFDRLDESLLGETAPAEVAPTVLDLTEDERLTLREAMQRHVAELLHETAGTESHPLQHELARTIDSLENIARKLERQPGSGS
jgi:uncharacterized protein (DUF302 family)